MNIQSTCHCGSAMYKNAWCDMLKHINSEPQNILHLYYKLQDLQDEIEKRSSYLGKLRRTEEAQHLLELISMTRDEEDLFYPFAKSAMADVHTELNKISANNAQCLFNEGGETITINIPSADAMVRIVQLESNTDSQDGKEKLWFDDGSIEITLSNDIDLTTYKVIVTFEILFNTQYTILATGQVITTQHSFLCSKTIDNTTPTNPNIEHLYFNDDFFTDYVLQPQSEFTSAESVIDNSYYASVKQITVEYQQPIEYSKNDYVLFNGTLTIANSNGNSNDTTPLVETEDYRHSIHYIIAYHKLYNEYLLTPLDINVFEALVNRIIYKWLMFSYPDEAPIYLAQYQEHLGNINSKSRLFQPATAKLIPRIF